MDSFALKTAAFYSGIYLIFKQNTKIRVISSLINASTLVINIWYPMPPIYLNGYITGYFIYDTIIGHFYDRKNFGLLSGYIHHPVYICLLTYLRYKDDSHLINIFLPFEIPTALQDIKKLAPSKMTDAIFGTSFLAFRVFYNIYVITKMPTQMYATLSGLMLVLHIYWFSQWINRSPK